MKLKKTVRTIKIYAAITAGVFLASLGINLFLAPHAIVSGGASGIAILVNRLTGFPMGTFMLLINIPLFILGSIFLGHGFGIRSIYGTILFSVLTDVTALLPGLTENLIMASVFGGALLGMGFGIVFLAGATSGGTDFIAISLSERYNYDSFHYIFAGNVVMLLVAGLLFGWDKALYSIIFQFASTQVVRMLNRRYQQTTLFIISDFAEQVFHKICEATHHSATLFHGTGLYNGQSRTMLYSVISSDQVKDVIRQIRQVDPKAFINVVKTEQVTGRFYLRPND